MLQDKDAAQLLPPLIAGLVEQPPWQGFLEALRARLGADYASLVFRPLPLGTPEARVIHLYVGVPSPPEVSRHYRENFYLRDPVPYHAMAEGRCHALADLLAAPVTAPHGASYFRELLAPSGMNHLRMIRCAEPGGVSGWITVTRREADFAAGADRLLEDLAPHLRAALAALVALERERLTADITREAVRRMNFGWLTLDAAGRVCDGDAIGADLLAAAGLSVQGRDGRLTARDPQLRRQLHAAIRELAEQPQARPRALVIRRDPWLDLLLVPSGGRMGATRATPAVLCYLHADHWSSADRCEQLAQLFDLTRSEARLALALSRGATIAEAAPDIGLTVESARTYSKRIYAKTGARGAADLVRFIHRSVLAMA